MFLSRLSPRALTANFILFALAITGAAWTSQASAHGSQHKDRDTIVFTVDVAEDFSLFNPTLVKPTDTQPERGSFFVTEGNIYPGGTIKGDGANFDPSTAGFGRWFCRGTHLVPASAIPAAAFWVHTAQLFLLPDDTRSIATEGVEGNGTVTRLISGGTGKYRGYVGEQRQEFLGFNSTGGVNLRVTFILKKAAR
jgi:hypothetical protein